MTLFLTYRYLFFVYALNHRIKYEVFNLFSHLSLMQIAHMTKSELQLPDTAFIGPSLLFLNQYFNSFIDEHIVLWIAMVSILNTFSRIKRLIFSSFFLSSAWFQFSHFIADSVDLGVKVQSTVDFRWMRWLVINLYMTCVHWPRSYCHREIFLTLYTDLLIFLVLCPTDLSCRMLNLWFKNVLCHLWI